MATRAQPRVGPHPDRIGARPQDLSSLLQGPIAINQLMSDRPARGLGNEEHNSAAFGIVWEFVGTHVSLLGHSPETPDQPGARS
jgi:hypothetical protein